LGVLLGDGCVYEKEGTIILSAKDQEFCRKI